MAGIFQPTLQTQVQPERAVADSSAATAINALTDVASGFFRSQQASKGSGPTYKQAKLEKFSNELNRLEQLSETDGISPSRFQADLSLAARQVASLEVPEALRVQYENLSGSPFEAFSYDDPEEFQKNQLLKSDFAQGIRPSVITQIEAEGGAATPEAIDAAVLAKVEEKNLLDNQVEIQRQNRALGRPVQTTPILESIQSDYQVLLDAVKGAQADNIVEQAEYRSLQTSVNNLIATKYTGFETNPEINGVIQQMNGLLNDIGKGVSSTPSAVLADTIQVALQSKGFSTSTIAIARAQLEQNPETFQTNFGTNEEGETVADALVAILEDAGTGKSLVDIFDTNTAPERPVVAGEKPAAMDIPSVSENPEAYQQVVNKLSQSAATTDPNTLLGKTEARNSWLTTMNIVGSAVKSQSNEFILGEKLLSMFASNGVVKNLEAVYRTDPANAVQTNSILQEGLAAERVRQRNELDQRLNTGDGEYFKVDQSGKVVFDMDFIEGKFAGASLGERRLASLKETIGRIDEVGGLEAFMRLPDSTRNEVLQGSGLERIVTTRFGKTLKLVSNLRMIDTKLGNLQDLATKYQDDTNLFAGQSEGTTDQTQNNGVQSTTASLIERYESGRGGYDTLFGQAQGSGGPFEGYKVSQKTLGELYEFSNPSGAQGTYGAYVKATNPKEVLATPMGRFQFVGTTLKEVAKKMGLPDDTVFNKETQDAMFLFLARDVMAGKSQAGKIKALRNTWDGFNNASDAELIQMIAEVEGGNPNLGGGGTTTPEYTPRVTTTVLPPATTSPEVMSTAPESFAAPSVDSTQPTIEAGSDVALSTLPPEELEEPQSQDTNPSAVVVAEGLSEDVKSFLDKLDEDIPDDKVKELLDYFGIRADTEFGNMIANSLTRSETEQGQKRKAEALRYFLDQLQR